MKYTLTIKDPDGIHYFLRSIENQELVKRIASKFFSYEECCAIEIDTVTMTARVVPTDE